MSSSLAGKFFDTVGLSYESGSIKGTTGADGDFQYEPNTDICFSIGTLQLGRTLAKRTVSLLDLAGKNPDLNDPKLLNRARLLLSLSPGQGFEKKIVIDEKIEGVVSRYASEINLDSNTPSDLDYVLSSIGIDLQIPPKSIPHVRNHLRRAASGFKVLRDVKIPVRDGNYVLGDVYLPLEDGEKYPVLVGSTIYGKRIVYSGPNIQDPEDVAAFEKAEDDWFSTSDKTPIYIPNTGAWFGNWTKQRRYETIGTFNTFTWLPRGYAMLKIDPRGVGQTPGTRNIPGQESNDLFDAVEWATKQDWCTGNVALAGNSYGANCQWAVARMKPKGLKAFIPYATDIDSYRDVAYIGGIPVFGYLKQWFNGVRAASPRWKDTGHLIDSFEARPFYDQSWEAAAQQVDDISLPVFLAASQVSLVHSRGSFEAWNRMASKDKYLQIVDGNYYGWPNHEVSNKLVLFADRYLKDIQHDDLEKVGIQMRTGDGHWHWRTENDWVIPGTQYVKWHLGVDGSLSQTRPLGPEKIFSYSAEPEPTGGQAGVTFTSEAFKEDVELAGHFTATIQVSSTSHDADVVILLWAVDESEKIVRYCVGPSAQPLVYGLLRASHRKLDIDKSKPCRPYHTHNSKDYAPLRSGEVVEINVEIFPATARIKKGWKLRLDITPSEEQPNVEGYHPRKLRIWEKSFHDGAINAIHVGGDRTNFVSIPVVPFKNPTLLL